MISIELRNKTKTNVKSGPSRLVCISEWKTLQTFDF